MSVFAKSLKTFKSDVTGVEREYRVNNAVWIYMLNDFELTQGQWADEFATNESLTLAKFVACVLKANGIETSLQEVLDNTDNLELLQFLFAYQGTLAPKDDDENNEKKTV